jgi:hypothetical protein
MAITDIQISEELETNAPSIKYRGNEGPKSPQEMEMMMMMSGGQPLPEDPTKPVNPFAPKPTGPVLPNKMMAGTDTPEIEIEMLQELLKLFREKFNRDPVSIDELKRAIGQMREKAAYGGIMGMDGRKQYGIGSWFQENIMDPIKKNPEIAAAAALYGIDTFGLPGTEIGGDKRINEGIGNIFEVLNKERKGPVMKRKDGSVITDEKGNPIYEERGSILGDITSGLTKNIIPIVGGLGAGIFTKNQPEQPGLPDDTTALQLADLKKSANILDQEQGLAAGLNFLPAVSARKFTPAEMIETYAQSAANGGRIGYNQGNTVLDEQTTAMILDMGNRGMDVPTISTITQTDVNTVNAILSSQNKKAEGGIMDLGGMEKDYRAEGGFVPIGKEEKADDVPARLSVNEFVFTADAVRNAGGGDIDQGARVMENMMKHLEAGGQVSEESQGMAGARDMFAVSERLSEVV